jgi:5-methyltetrahydropteroyltriglutamate--homocysteine methyltransferase
MAPKTSLTGSYPPVHNPEKPIADIAPEKFEQLVRDGIERAIKDQIQIGIDYLVDGQIRNDIVSLFVNNLPGFDSLGSFYKITGKICPAEIPFTVNDYAYARQYAGNHSVKAHITGPMTISRVCQVDPSSPYTSRNDPKLIEDLAIALGQEAKALVEAGAQIVQIDEPVLQDGVSLKVAFEALKKIIEIGQIPIPSLHICGNVSQILPEVLDQALVKIVSMEGVWLTEDRLMHIDENYLKSRNKQIGLGCIQVSDYKLDRLTKVQNFLDQMTHRLGESIWAITPNCGMRVMPYETAKQKLELMVKAARSI